MSEPLPVYADKQTFSVLAVMSQHRTQAVQHDQRKKKDRLAAAFPRLDLFGAGAADELSRSMKLEHIDAGQRYLVNDRTRQRVSRKLILIGVITRHSVDRYDDVKTT
jgi:hypothetical protein